jgi:hypothetical protein
MAITRMPEWCSWRAATCACAKLIRDTDELQPYLQKAQADILAARATQAFTIEAWCTLEG